MKLLISEHKIKGCCKRIAREISQTYRTSKNEINGVVLIGIANGVLPFLVDMSREIAADVPVEIDLVHCSSYTGMFKKGKVKFSKLPSTDLTNKLVIIVDDIVDSGDTMTAVSHKLLKFKPKAIQTCCLLKRKSCKSYLHYLGRVVDDGLWVIGYGLDDDGLKRNMKQIYIKQ